MTANVLPVMPGEAVSASLSRDFPSDSNDAVAWRPGRLWSLWDMLQSYLPIYQIAQELERLRAMCGMLKSPLSSSKMPTRFSDEFRTLLKNIIRECPRHGLTHTSEMAKRVNGREPPETYSEMFSALEHLDDSLMSELDNELIFRIPSDRISYFERDELFGSKVAASFPSCERDIRKAGDCYALGQEDACVHHLMLVLERGLNALAAKVGVSYQRTNWQTIIEQIGSKLKVAPRGPDRDFYLEVNAQFGFLKDAYRNHSEHARDEHYDMPKALSILNHVSGFMQALQKGGLSE